MTGLAGLDLGILALAAVLRAMGSRGGTRNEVERAVALAIRPSAQGGIAPIAIPWDDVLRRAAIEQLLEIGADGRWCAGPDIDDAPSDEFDGRALGAVARIWSATTAPRCYRCERPIEGKPWVVKGRAVGPQKVRLPGAQLEENRSADRHFCSRNCVLFWQAREAKRR